jgi:hypothetical protein
MKALSTYTAALIIFLTVFIDTADSQVLGLYGDESRQNVEIGWYSPYTPGTPFSVFVFLEPGQDGAFAVEYKLECPPNHYSVGQEISPVVSSATIGTWLGAPGISAPFLSCQDELFWVAEMIMVSPDTVSGYYSLEPNDDSGFLGIAICPDPRPLAEAAVINHLCFFSSCTGAAKATSWGAIKQMHR